jgi:selenocysteine lyase/cysteine desulfurase
LTVAAVAPVRFRERFPIFERRVFLNSCSKGALSLAVEDAYRRYLDSWKNEGSPWDDWVAMLEKLRKHFARLAGASEGEIAITFSASTAAATVLSALSFEGERNRILVPDFDFPTMVYNWLAQERRGAEIVRIRARGNRLDPDAYLGELDERVRLVALPHVCFRNGFRLDVESITASARKRGAYSFVDDYQSTGTRPLDVKRMGCDFLVTGALKYLLGSSGLAFLYVRRELAEELEPLVTGWFGQQRPFDFDIERATYHESVRRFESGTPPVPNLYAGIAGLEVLGEIPPGEIERHVDSLASALIEGAKARGFEVVTPLEPGSRGPLVVLCCRDAGRLVEELRHENIVVSARGSGLRVSFHYYNVPEDVEALLRVLDRHERLVARASDRR